MGQAAWGVQAADPPGWFLGKPKLPHGSDAVPARLKALHMGSELSDPEPAVRRREVPMGQAEAAASGALQVLPKGAPRGKAVFLGSVGPVGSPKATPQG